MSTRVPIWIPCEGVGAKVHFPRFEYHGGIGESTGMCVMCGELVDAHNDITAKLHNRKDIIAMIERGDFG